MDRNVTVVIDQKKCTGCGACIPVCPSQTITLKDKCAQVTGTESLNCGHCAAACPVDAITVGALDMDQFNLNSISLDNKWISPGEFSVHDLTQLMRSRRSCRNFTDKPVSAKILEDLVKIGITAPSGTNSQKWVFTILPTAASVVKLTEKIGWFFRKLNLMASSAVLRTGLKLMGQKDLDFYYKEYYESVTEALDMYKNLGIDRLFHHAPAVIIVTSAQGASCPQDDALLATQNILLAAHSMGLGTCLIGFAVQAIQREKKIQKYLGIPLSETCYSVIALGYPKEKYYRPAERKPVTIRYFT